MIFPRGARLITPAENQRFSPGEPDFCPTRKIRDFSRGDPLFAPREKSEIFPVGTPYAPAEKYCRRGTFSGRCARSRARVIFNEIIPLPRRKSRCGGIIPPHPLARVLHPRAPILFVYCLFKLLFCQGVASKKILHGVACKIFRALDNDDKLKFTNSGRHFLPSALIA